MIAVLGGGISGLAAAYKLKQLGKEVVLLEASDKLGGKIQSLQMDGFTFELGPNTVLVNNPSIKALLDDIDLTKEIIEPEPLAVKSRFVLKNGNIEPIPNSFSTALKSKLFSFSTLANILSEPFRKAKKDNSEESLADFSRRRFGNQIFEDFITPFITGIYAGDPEKMSINHTLSILKDAEQMHGSVIKGMMKIMKEKKAANESAQLPKQKIFTFQAGLGRMIEVLGSNLGDSVKTKSSIKSIQKSDNGFEIQLENETIHANQIISTIPAHQLTQLTDLIDNNLSSKLSNINYVPAVVSHFSFPKSALKFKQAAFGILSRKTENVPFLGVLFNARFFPHQAPANQDLITVISGGYRQAELIEQSEEDILNTLETSLVDLLGIESQATFRHCYKWQKGIPQYELGHDEILDAIAEFESQNNGFYIRGNFGKGISVSDCVESSFNLAEEINA